MGRETCDVVARRGPFLLLAQRWRFVAVAPNGATVAETRGFTSGVMGLRNSAPARRSLDGLVRWLAAVGWEPRPMSPALTRRDRWYRVYLWRRTPR